jgi:hypothetical protein
MMISLFLFDHMCLTGSMGNRFESGCDPPKGVTCQVEESGTQTNEPKCMKSHARSAENDGTRTAFRQSCTHIRLCPRQ